MSDKRPLEFSYDAEFDVMTIEGHRYRGEFFRTIAEPEEGALYSYAIEKDGDLRIFKKIGPPNRSCIWCGAETLCCKSERCKQITKLMGEDLARLLRMSRTDVIKELESRIPKES